MEGVVASWRDSWIKARVPSGGDATSKSQSWEGFGGGVKETLDRVPESWFMILLQDTCRDPDRGKILTTTGFVGSIIQE